MGVLFSYTGNLYGAGDFPSVPALQSAAGNTALPPAPIPENPLAGRFLQGGAWAFFIDNMGAMRYYYKVSVCLFAGHTPENQV